MSIRGSAELVEGNQRRAAQAAIGVEARPRAEKRQRLTNRTAFALEVVGSPQNNRDRIGKRMTISSMAGEDALGLPGAVGNRERARDR